MSAKKDSLDERCVHFGPWHVDKSEAFVQGHAAVEADLKCVGHFDWSYIRPDTVRPYRCDCTAWNLLIDGRFNCSKRILFCCYTIHFTPNYIYQYFSDLGIQYVLHDLLILNSLTAAQAIVSEVFSKLN